MASKADDRPQKQLLHLVFGGELESLSGTASFRDLDRLDIVGIYPNYRKAYDAWKAAAQQTVDNAHMRYFIVHMHRLLDPELIGRDGPQEDDDGRAGAGGRKGAGGHDGS